MAGCKITFINNFENNSSLGDGGEYNGSNGSDGSDNSNNSGGSANRIESGDSNSGNSNSGSTDGQSGSGSNENFQNGKTDVEHDVDADFGVGENSGSGSETGSETGFGTDSDAGSNSDVDSDFDSDVDFDSDSDIKKIIENMTLREKVGQLFVVRPDSLDFLQTDEQINNSSASGVTQMTAALKSSAAKYPVGGFVLFSKNIKDEDSLIEFIADLKADSEILPFVCVDEEGGAVARLANHPEFLLPKYSSAAEVGKSGNINDALEMGKTIGHYLEKYGFNLDFAPVADVNTNPNNPIIGNRAFSSDAKIAAKMAVGMARGLSSCGIIPVFKHFPGHGDTEQDSHGELAVSFKTKKELEECEWLPYASLNENSCVMVGHIAVPNLTRDYVPASMSYKIVTEILRGELGFDGVVVTDSLAMGAITEQYSAQEAALGAILAGCDVLLCPREFEKTFNYIIQAAENGKISEQRLDESVFRILKLKKTYGLIDWSLIA